MKLTRDINEKKHVAALKYLAALQDSTPEDTEHRILAGVIESHIDAGDLIPFAWSMEGRKA